MRKKLLDFNNLHHKALAMRDMLHQQLLTVRHSVKYIAQDSAINIWNMVAGDDIRTLAGHHPLSAKIIAGIDLADVVRLTYPFQGKVEATHLGSKLEHSMRQGHGMRMRMGH
jgi:hypothetical protein